MDKIFIRGKEITAPEGFEAKFTCDRESGFKVTFVKTDTKKGAITDYERRQTIATYYDGQGTEVARLETDTDWQAKQPEDLSMLKPGWKATRSGEF